VLRGALLAALVGALLSGCGAAGPTRLALRGTILTPDRAIDDGLLVIEGDRISAVLAGATAPDGVPIVDTGGIILPGLIDLHNHPLWSAFPRWRAGGAFRNRDDWARAPAYVDGYVTPERELLKTMTCELSAFGEIKAIVGGATSMRGSPATRCSAGLVRNLEFDRPLSEGLLDGTLSGLIDVDILSDEQAARLLERLRSGSVQRLFVHVGEGRADHPAPREEFQRLVDYGLLTERTVIIHGTGLGDAEFDAMASAGATLVWSPRSTLELYGETTSISMAIDRGIRVALAPDWSLTGSANLLDELRTASEWSRQALGTALDDRLLVRMVTSDAAAIAALETRIGSLEPGHLADVLVVRKRDAEPYRSVVVAQPADVRLVMVGGQLVYGAADLMSGLRDRWDVEPVKVCDAAMVIDTTADRASLLDYRHRLSQIQSRLGRALGAFGLALAPIAEC
jgi:cytosine/adenosine deaminase-related metal-dependent hydrolase